MGEIVEIIIKDFSGAKIESFSFRVSDEKKASSVMRTLKKKYGLSLDLEAEFPKRDKDLDWLNKS